MSGIVEVVHPLINQVLASVPDRLSLPFLLVFSSVFVIDNVVTVVTVAKLNQRLQQLDEVARALRRVSDAFGSVAADGNIALSDAKRQAQGRSVGETQVFK